MNILDASSFNVEEYLPLNLNKLFTLLRSWHPSIQKNFSRLVLAFLENEIENIDEHDLSTGMNLLHFTCKYGAKKIGYEKEAIDVLNHLIRKGVNLTLSCLWIKMNCLHYCAFFDSPLLCEVLLNQSKVSSLLNQPCPSFDNQTPLHLACASLSLATGKILIKFGANEQSLDDQKRTPKTCIPSGQNHVEEISEKIKSLFSQSGDQTKISDVMSETLIDSTIDLDTSTAPQFQIDERVRLANNKMGTVKYFGSVPFGVNLWYGVELDEPTGKHDGCVGGMRYFTCPPNRGIFVQPSSLQKLTPVPQSPERERRFRPINYPILDTSQISSRVDSGLRRDSSADDHVMTERFHIDDRVALSKNRHGTIKYVGPTPLGAGLWYGIELDSPNGLHDGCLSVDGQRYFQCKPQHGVFVRGQNLKKVNKTDRRTISLTTSLDRHTKPTSRMITSDYDATMLSSSIVEDDAFTKSIDSSIQSVTFNIGDKVLYHQQLAIVRYIGTTLFADGIWIGIEFLSRSLGKNDGSVNGHVYFQCKSNHGLFIRPNRLTLAKK